MRFLVDECTGTSVVAYLRSTGHDAVAVVDVLPEADDEDILDYAVAEGRIVATNVITPGCNGRPPLRRPPGGSPASRPASRPGNWTPPATRQPSTN